MLLGGGSVCVGKGSGRGRSKWREMGSGRGSKMEWGRERDKQGREMESGQVGWVGQVGRGVGGDGKGGLCKCGVRETEKNGP